MMQAALMRQVAPHLAIATALCIGAWMILVQPRLDKLSATESARAQSSVRLTPEQQWQLVEHLEDIDAWLDQCRAQSELVQDSNRLYSNIMKLAEGRGVQIIRVQPATPRSGVRSHRKSQTDAPVDAAHIEIVARGRYETIAAFIEDVASQSLFIRPRSLEIAPASDGPPPTIHARLMCDLLSMRPSTALVQLEGMSNAP